MIAFAAILFAAGWIAGAITPGRPGGRPELGPAVQKQLRRTRAPWIQ